MVWAAKRVSLEKMRRVEMTPYQEALLGRIIRPNYDDEEGMSAEKDVMMSYSATVGLECLEGVESALDKAAEVDAKLTYLRNEVGKWFWF